MHVCVPTETELPGFLAVIFQRLNGDLKTDLCYRSSMLPRRTRRSEPASDHRNKEKTAVLISEKSEQANFPNEVHVCGGAL